MIVWCEFMEFFSIAWCFLFLLGFSFSNHSPPTNGSFWTAYDDSPAEKNRMRLPKLQNNQYVLHHFMPKRPQSESPPRQDYHHRWKREPILALPGEFRMGLGAIRNKNREGIEACLFLCFRSHVFEIHW